MGVALYFDYNTLYGNRLDVDVVVDPEGAYDIYSGSTTDVTVSGDVVSGTVELWGDQGVVGEAVLNATLSVVGEPETVEDEPRHWPGGQTNVITRYSDTFQGQQATGILTVLGTDLDLTGCFGQRGHVRYWSTSPAAYVASGMGRTLYLGCNFSLADGRVVSLFAELERPTPFARVDVRDEQGVLQQGDDVDPAFKADEFHAAFEMFDPFTEEPTGGTATADATLTRVGLPQKVWDQDGRVRITYDVAVEGTLSVSGVGDFDMSECEGIQFLQYSFLQTPNGPPGPPPRPGAPPANDLPDDAIYLTPGDTVQVDTSGAAPEGEVGTACLGGNAPGYSVWYALDVTGRVVLDPAGSDFDTVVAAYTRDGDSWTEIGCADDDEDLQGGLTLEGLTDEVTIWVQLGGYGPTSGGLVLTVS